jgi:hypothetical protein
MALLFNNFNELKPYLGSGHINNNIDSVASFLEDAALEFIIPVIGKEVFNELKTKFEASEIGESEVWQQILDKTRRPITHFGYFLLAMDGGLEVDDRGFQAIDTGTTKRPYQWQMRDFKKNRLKNGWNALENLLTYLQDNVEDIEEWENSEARAYFNSLWLKTNLDYSQHRKIDGFGTLWRIAPYCLNAQQNEIKENLGEDLYNLYKSYIEESGDSEELAALKPMINRALVFITLSRAIMDIPFTVSFNGLRIEEVDAIQNNSDIEKNAENLEPQAAHYRTLADQAINQLRNYLDENASAELYPEYFESDLYAIKGEDNSRKFDDEINDSPTFLM